MSAHGSTLRHPCAGPGRGRGVYRPTALLVGDRPRVAAPFQACMHQETPSCLAARCRPGRLVHTQKPTCSSHWEPGKGLAPLPADLLPSSCATPTAAAAATSLHPQSLMGCRGMLPWHAALITVLLHYLRNGV